ncbi:MAG: TraM recognition domain-containing protein, partial [Patescibacteria group bacterium]|nr:TraM recognition domain-containing protein [Patescibacteria group bacterium]
KVVENVTDPIDKSIWVDEFANYTDRYTQDATPAIQNKVGQFTSNPLIRNIVGQPKSSFDIRACMDDKKIIIMNLSKGRVGEVNATLLGSMLVTKIYLAAMSRADVPMQVLDALPPFYFYVDEFQSFSNQSFADILSEARKYKLNLIIAHQYIEQMEEEVRDAVFGNVGTTVAFRVGPFDAEVLETIFKPQFTETDLVNLGFAQVYLTLMIDGIGSPPFSATTLPPFDFPPERFTPQVIESSRRQFSKPRAQVEEAIKKWHESDPAPELSKPTYEFYPDGSRRPKPGDPSRRSRAEAERKTTVFKKPKPVEAQSRETQPPVKQKEEPRLMAPHAAKPKPHAPPLEGTNSLKEALARATQKPVHAPDLKDTLQEVAPKAAAPESKHGGLPKHVLEEMLAVDEPHDHA